MTDITPKGLLPCAHCGSEAKVWGEDADYLYKLVRVVCRSESCGTSGNNYATHAEAITAWNRRAADQLERQAWIPCSERMPESAEVLVTVETSGGGQYTDLDQWDEKRREWQCLGEAQRQCRTIRARISHWMPIPPLPPEGES